MIQLLHDGREQARSSKRTRKSGFEKPRVALRRKWNMLFSEIFNTLGENEVELVLNILCSLVSYRQKIFVRWIGKGMTGGYSGAVTIRKSRKK